MFTILAGSKRKSDNSLVMDRYSILIAGLFTFLFVGIGAVTLFSQSSSAKCPNGILAINMTPVSISKRSETTKIPCEKEKKRLSESQETAVHRSISYYDNVMIDQLGDTFINALPGLTSSPAPSRPCNSADKQKDKKQLTACETLKKKNCEPKAEDEEPKQLRPSATVKLAHYRPGG